MEETKFADLNDKRFNGREFGKRPKLKINKKKLAKTLGIIGGVILVLGLLFGRPAYAVLNVAKDLAKDARNIKDSLILRDLVMFEESLESADRNLDRLSEVREQRLRWVEKVPLLKIYYKDSKHFIVAGKHAIAAGQEFVVLVEPFADAAGLKVADDVDLPSGHTGLPDAFATWVGVMPQVAQDMDKIILEIAAIGEEMEKVDASKYPRKIFGKAIRPLIKSTQNTLSEADEYGEDIKKALTIIPGLLGVNTDEQRYAIIMQNDKEIRATGGFWTNYATFKVDNGMLSSDFSSQDMYSLDFILDEIDPYHTFPKVPAKYEKWLKVERMYARDANISPDFPTAIDQWMYFYELAMDVRPLEVKPIKGVVAIDTQVVKEFLEVTGSVTANGITFSEDNVVLELEKIASLSLAEQANRKKVLGDLMEGMLKNVFEADAAIWSDLIDTGVDLVRRKHVLATLFNEDADALLEKYKMNGVVIAPEKGDYAYSVHTNLGGDKTNWFVKKDVTHSLEKEDGRWIKTVDLEYKYELMGGEYDVLVKRFQDWMRLYVPKGSELISLEGSSDEAETVESEDLNKTYFSGFKVMQPNEVSHMVFKYYLPEGVIDGNTYNLYIQKQPGTNGETHTVIVNGEQKAQVTLDTDKELSIEL